MLRSSISALPAARVRGLLAALVVSGIALGCATDDLAGYTERQNGETKHEAGFLDGFGLSREECEAMIMQARLKAGWVTEADLAPPAEEAPAEEAAPASAQ